MVLSSAYNARSPEKVLLMVYQTDESTRLRRQRADQAIKLAMQGRWDDAVAVNRSIIELTGGRDVDAFNRLGRALMALGRNREALDAYASALQLDPANQIAKKNVATLEKKIETQPEATTGRRSDVDPSLFVEETGKTGVTLLQHPRRETLSHMTVGERVLLKREGNLLLATNVAGEVIGQVEPRIALRLNRLMDGGNEYAAAIAQLSGDQTRVIIKETFQHPSQAGRLSFPPAGADGQPRPYTREGLVRYDDEDEELLEETELGEGWETDGEAQDQGDVTLLDYQKAHEREERDESLFDEE
jgi:tetratricopeptide (TPR) repeat protein